MKTTLMIVVLTPLVMLLPVGTAKALPTATTSTETNDISDISGWALVAEARSGSNGNTNLPDPDFDLIDPSWNGDGGYITWDPNLTSGFQAGPVNAVFTVDLANGTASFSITDSSNSTYTANYTGVSGTLQKIMLRAAVETPGHCQWNSPTVDFYRSGSFVESYYSGTTSPAIDTTTTSYTVADQMLTVTPTDSNDTKVVISGELEFDTSDTAPGPNDLFSQIFVFTN